MDINQYKKNADQRLIASQIKKQMIQTIKEYRNQTLDQDFQSSKLFKPIIKAQKEVKDTIDQKQDKLNNLNNLIKNKKLLYLIWKILQCYKKHMKNQKKRQNYLLVTNQQ